MAMVIGSIVFSSNPRETLWKYIKGFASFMSWVISYLVRHVLSLAPFSLAALLTLYVSSPQFTKKTNPIEQDIITLRESLKVSNKAIDDLKNTLKHFMTSTQRILAIDSHKTSDNDIVLLKSQVNGMKQLIIESQKAFLTGLHDRVKFLEDIYRYECILGKDYSKETHISGKIMGRLMELCILDDDGSSTWRRYGIYINGNGREQKMRWNSWITHATEEDLMDFITVIYRRDTRYILTFPFVGISIANYDSDTNNYRVKMAQLKKATDSWCPSSLAYSPGISKTFAEDYFNRIENVLTKIHKMGLLK